MMKGETLGKLGMAGFVASIGLSIFSKWLSQEADKYKTDQLEQYVDKKVDSELKKRGV